MSDIINADTGDTLEILKNITPSTISNNSLRLDKYSTSAPKSFKIVEDSKPVSNSNNNTFNEIKQLYHEVYGI